MRKLLLVLLILTLLLCGCDRQEAQPTEPSAPPTQGGIQTDPTNQIPITEPTEIPPTETIPATEPEETEPPTEPSSKDSLDYWQPEKPQYLSYEEYFSQARPLDNSSTSWIKGGQVFRCSNWNGAVTISDLDGWEYTVPDSHNFVDYSLLGANGRYAYLTNDIWLVQLNLATGVYDVIFVMESGSIKRLMDNLVLYYCEFADGMMTIGRLYLPTLDHDVLCQQSGEYYKFYLRDIPSTAGPITWEMSNPEFVAVVKQELANPESPYRVDINHDYGYIWEAENGLEMVMKEYVLMDNIQDGTGIHALIRCSFDPTTGSFTQQTGVIDDCFYGSDKSHDHFSPHISSAPEPEILLGDWTQIPGSVGFHLCKEGVDEDSYLGKGITQKATDSYTYLYAKTQGDYVRIVDEPVLGIWDTQTCIIYTTQDDRVMAISYDGSERIELYQAQDELTFAKYNYGFSNLVIQDGDTLVQIDLVNLRYRPLARHESISYFTIDSDYKNHTDYGIYFNIRAGLYSQGYTLNWTTGELQPSYRL